VDLPLVGFLGSEMFVTDVATYDLRRLFESAIDDDWDAIVHRNAIAQEQTERDELTDYAARFAREG
jgi:hypothetical protein